MSFKFVMLPPQSEITLAWAERLRDTVPGIRIETPSGKAQTETAIVDADAAYGIITPDLLERSGRLRWLQAPHAAPAAGFYFPALVDHPLAVTNMREIYNDHIGNHVMAYVLAFARDLPHYLRRQVHAEWSPKPLNEGVLHLAETTMLIVGLGGIGAETARLASAFGIKVIATDARRTTPAPGVDELRPANELDALLPRADFVVLTVPHTPATEGFFDHRRFDLMKRGAFFINIGRGRTTRLDALSDALRSGGIAGAAIDVVEIEPLPADHPLWAMENVIITPHVSGYGPHLTERRFEVILDNCRAFAEGRQLRNVVDKENWF